MQDAAIYIGLMSGTSLDGIDAVAAQFTPEFKLLGSCSVELPAPLRERILALCTPDADEIDRMGSLDRDLAEAFADAALQLTSTLDLPKAQIAAIGSHGQTIRHRPELGFTLQIGDPNLIAESTSITTVADFRRRDMAVGGQGAPLVPAFHKALFQTADCTRVIVNIGGMANITLLPADPSVRVTGYDTGPGNVLLDAWIEKHQQRSYDANGEWAASGRVNYSLLAQLLSLPYFRAEPPKSTGREQFNLAWLEQQLDSCSEEISPQDVQATLLELTARTIADEIDTHDLSSAEIYLCGGGSHNQTLKARLQALLAPHQVETTTALKLDPDWVEAAAFAWLAYRTLNRMSGNLPDVTGASGERILGAIYPA